MYFRYILKRSLFSEHWSCYWPNALTGTKLRNARIVSYKTGNSNKPLFWSGTWNLDCVSRLISNKPLVDVYHDMARTLTASQSCSKFSSVDRWFYSQNFPAWLWLHWASLWFDDMSQHSTRPRHCFIQDTPTVTSISPHLTSRVCPCVIRKCCKVH